MKYWLGLFVIALTTGFISYQSDIIVKKTNAQKAVTISGHPQIVDGDTLKYPDLRIRFAKIDTCELSQPAITKHGQIDCGVWATNELINLVDGEKITCFGERFDRFERLIAECRTKSVEDLGIAMLERGYAFPYFEEKLPKAARIATKSARDDRLGVWGFINVEWPYQWRKTHRRK